MQRFQYRSIFSMCHTCGFTKHCVLFPGEIHRQEGTELYRWGNVLMMIMKATPILTLQISSLFCFIRQLRTALPCVGEGDSKRIEPAGGKRIRNVVNIGIGGSDLGPVMAYEALRHYSERSMTFRFVSNVDGIDFSEATRDLDPAETMVIVSSKTFTTLETMTNAQTCSKMAVEWLGRQCQGRGKTFCCCFDQCPKSFRVRH